MNADAYLLTVNVGPSDEWLRAEIRFEHPAPAFTPTLQHVLVDTAAEADRLFYRLAALKTARHLPFGGGSIQRLSYVRDVPPALREMQTNASHGA